MPVHEIRYQTWQGNLMPPLRRLFAIPRFTLLTVFNKWIALAMFSGVAQLIIYTFYLLITTNPLIRQLLGIRQQQFDFISSHEIFHYFLTLQFFVCIAVSLLAAPRMVSPEIQHNALPLIYSRPISRSGYIFGKFMAISLLLSLLTWVQIIVLFGIMMAIYPSTDSFWLYFWKMGPQGSTPSILLLFQGIALGLIITITLSLFSLACSSATRNYVYSGVLFLVIMFGTSFVTLFIQETFNMAGFPDLGLREIVMDLGLVWFGKMNPGAPSPDKLATYISILPGLIIWPLASYFFMRWRLRPVDIYGE